MTKFKKLLKGLLKERGMQQKDLADAIGVNAPVFTNWNSGKAQPSREKVRLMERALGVEEGTIEQTMNREMLPYEPLYNPSKRELEILKAWKRGERTPEEVSKITGYSLEIVGKYLPIWR